MRACDEDSGRNSKGSAIVDADQAALLVVPVDSQ